MYEKLLHGYAGCVFYHKDQQGYKVRTILQYEKNEKAILVKAIPILPHMPTQALLWAALLKSKTPDYYSQVLYLFLYGLGWNIRQYGQMPVINWYSLNVYSG